jgi:phosphoribosylformylglycinamidine (FGAM) synthase-like amidotransferase family enzyme
VPPTIALFWTPGARLEAMEPDVRVVVPERGQPVRADAAVIAAGDDGEGAPETEGALREFAAAGGAVLGVGPGVAVLCRAGLLHGQVVPLSSGTSPPTHVRVEGRATSFTWAIPAGRVLPVDAASPTARYLAAEPGALEADGRVVLRYCDGAGGVRRDSVAGVCDARARVVGLLPGAPAASALRGNLGRQLLGSLRLAISGAWR